MLNSESPLFPIQIQLNTKIVLCINFYEEKSWIVRREGVGGESKSPRFFHRPGLSESGFLQITDMVCV